MRRTTFKLPLWVAAGILTATTAAAQAPVVPNVPQEDAYQLRALPPQEAQEEAETAVPNRYLETEFLKERASRPTAGSTPASAATAGAAPGTAPSRSMTATGRAR